MVCKPTSHKWEVEEIIGSMNESTTISTVADIELKLRCAVCNVSLQGVMKR